MSVNWEAIGAIGEIAGAIGVIATLAYLAVQLRQNTSALRSNTWQNIQEAELGFDAQLSTSPATCDVWLRGLEGGLDAFESAAERMQFYILAKQLIDQFQTHHYHYEKGLIEEDMWQTWVSQYQESLQQQGFRDVVDERRKHLRPSFAKLIDSMTPP